MKRTKYFRGRKFGMWNSIRISVQTILDKLFGIKIKVQKLKTDDGQDLEDITTWNEKFENDIGQHEDLIDSSVIKIKEHKHHRKVTIKEEKEEERLKRVSEEWKCIAEMNAQIPSEIGVSTPVFIKTGTYRPNLTVRATLPRLEITKFKVTHNDWFRFWTNMNQRSINAVFPKSRSFLTSSS